MLTVSVIQIRFIVSELLRFHCSDIFQFLFLKVVASGIFLDMNQGLPDPCEHDKLDVTSGLTIQQRENLTKTAQHYLRMMHFRQIHKVRRNLGC